MPPNQQQDADAEMNEPAPPQNTKLGQTLRDWFPIGMAFAVLLVGWGEFRGSIRALSEQTTDKFAAMQDQFLAQRRAMDLLEARLNGGANGTLEAQIALLGQRHGSLTERLMSLERIRAEDSRETLTRTIAWTQTLAEIRTGLASLSSEVAGLRQSIAQLQRRTDLSNPSTIN